MAFFQEDRRRREPFLRAPASVTILIVVLVAAHVLRTLVPDKVSDDIILRFGFIPAHYGHAYLTALAGIGSWLMLAVPFVSYVFVHANFAHVAINCLWLLAFGPVVARRLGTLPFLLFFFVCGIAAAIVHLLCNPGATDPAIGASGAISGVMAAGVRIVNFDRRFGMEPGHKLVPLLSRQVLAFSLLWLVTNVVAGLTGLGAGTVPGAVAWQAHIGGYFAGLFLVDLADRFGRGRTNQDLPGA